jgi:deoxyribonuclease V
LKRLFRIADSESEERRQERLAREVIEETPENFRPTLICGLDAAYSGEVGIGVATVWDCESPKIVEVQSLHGSVRVEYRPGFLGLREGPLVLAAAKRLRVVPDAYLVDGHGRAHPRRFGLACEVGLVLRKPTIGVAKGLLCGKIVNDTLEDGEGLVCARILKEPGMRPRYVSVGNLISLEEAFRVVKRCVFSRGVAPLKAAHHEAARLSRA